MVTRHSFLYCVLRQTSKRHNSTVNNYRLVEIGKFEKPRLLSHLYEPGQPFFHKIFGFRAVILFPWTARLFDRSAPSKKAVLESDGSSCETIIEKTAGGTELKGVPSPYYQVLIDERDLPHVRLRSHGHTMLSRESARGLITIHGLECVSHDDVLPYSSTEEMPIQHEYLPRFFKHKATVDQAAHPSDLLLAWKTNYLPWLQLTGVHREVTEGIRVTVMPFYMGCKENINSSEYWWRYSIRLENFNDESIVLRERHWKIFSNVCNLEQVHEKGVVGMEPELNRRQPAFEYSSHVMQRHPNGHMWGTYKMEKENGTTFECRIPSFALESKTDEHVDPICSLIDV